jgi:hypothetical protein
VGMVLQFNSITKAKSAHVFALWISQKVATNRLVNYRCSDVKNDQPTDRMGRGCGMLLKRRIPSPGRCRLDPPIRIFQEWS